MGCASAFIGYLGAEFKQTISLPDPSVFYDNSSYRDALAAGLVGNWSKFAPVVDADPDFRLRAVVGECFV